MKYISPKTAVKVTLKDIKGPGTLFGYLSVLTDTVLHLKQNLDEGRSGTHIASEAIVDVGVGVGSMATAAWIGGVVGSVGGPLGTLAGALVGIGVGYALSWLTDGWYIHGKTVSTHMKEGLENLIDGGLGLITSGKNAVSSIFH